MSSLAVAKFGGTSGASAYACGRIVGIIKRNQPDLRVLAISAPGKLTAQNNPGGRTDKTKVTDRLIGIAKNEMPLEEGIQAIKRQFSEIEDGMRVPEDRRISPKVESEIRERLTRVRDGYIDPVECAGEYLHGQLMTEILRLNGINAKFVQPEEIGFEITVEEDGRRHVKDSCHPRIREKLVQVLDEGYTAVVPGFYGPGSSGDITKLPRGGTDYTGAVLAVALDAGAYLNFTDMDGICVVEPSIDAETAPRLSRASWRELSELTLGGKFGIIQYEATVPLAKSRSVNMHVLNTFDANADGGTLVLPSRPITRGDEIAGIVWQGEFVAFEVLDYGMGNESGVVSDLSGIFREMKISLDHNLSNTNDNAVIVRESNMEQRGVTIPDIRGEIEKRLNPDAIRVHRFEIVAIVGEGISHMTDFVQRIGKVLASQDISVPAFGGFGPVRSMMLERNGDGKETRGQRLAKGLYEEFFPKKERSSPAPE